MNKRVISHWLTSHLAYSIYSSLAVLILYYSTHQPAPTLNTPNGVCNVVNIIDGDSIIVECNSHRHNLRLKDIDAPEISQPIWGLRAKKALTKLAKKTIFVEFHGKDTYQRDLAVIYSLDNPQESINLQLVKAGAVRVYARYSPPAIYKNTMRQAKKAQRGIWQKKGLHQDPMRYRRLAY